MESIKEVFGTMISYSPIVAEITGSIGSAVLLNQLIYWWERKREGKETVYKTIDEIKAETFLSRHKQDNAIKLLEKFGFVKSEIRGLPPKRHFTIDLEKIRESVLDYKSGVNNNEDQFAGNSQINLPESDKSICQKPANLFAEKRQDYLPETDKTICQKPAELFAENRQIYYTDITTKITTENTTEITTSFCGEKNSPEGTDYFFSDDMEEKKENNPPLLRVAPLEKEKKDKGQKESFSEITKKMKKVFLDFYLEKNSLPYCWGAKDAKNLIELEKKLSFMLTEVQKVPDEQAMVSNFRIMLENIHDTWILENFSVSIINMKFNEIVSKIKNGQNGQTKDSGRFKISPEYERSIYTRLYGDAVQ